MIPPSPLVPTEHFQGNNGVKSKKPGPRPNKCIWCNEIQCSHCQCPGYPKCDHRPGEPCLRQRWLFLFGISNRYKRRLVCNPCEKNKLKEDTSKRTVSRFVIPFLVDSRSAPKERTRLFRRRSDTGFNSADQISVSSVDSTVLPMTIFQL